MKTLGYYNGKIDELDQICVPMLDRASYFGDGVYDVTFCRNYKVYQLREHVERIFQSAALIKIYPQITPDELCELVEELVKKLDDGELWVYLQFSRGTDFRNHAFYPQERRSDGRTHFKGCAGQGNSQNCRRTLDG